MNKGFGRFATLIFIAVFFLFALPARAGQRGIYAATNNGVFKSTDGGATWTSANSGLGWLPVNALAIDPFNPATLYAGTYNYPVFKSTDGGQSWTRAISGFSDTIAYTLAIDPVHPGTIYAGTATSMAYPGNQVFKSTDGAQSWSVSNSGLPYTVVDILRIDLSNPDILYAGTNMAGVFKSTDAGQSWTAANLGMPYSMIEDLAVDPAHPATVYTCTDWNTMALSLLGVWKSVNGGIDWTIANDGLTDLQVISLAIDFVDPDTLYAGTRLQGVFKTTDGGANWNQANSGLPTTPYALTYRALVIDPFNTQTIYTGTVDGVFKSTDGGLTWTSASNGFPASTRIFALAVEPAPATTIASWIALVERSDLRSGEKTSLTAKLRAAQQSFASGNTLAAANQLRAFINHVQALERGGQVDPATASSLVIAAQAMIDGFASDPRG